MLSARTSQLGITHQIDSFGSYIGSSGWAVGGEGPFRVESWRAEAWDLRVERIGARQRWRRAPKAGPMARGPGSVF